MLFHPLQRHCTHFVGQPIHRRRPNKVRHRARERGKDGSNTTGIQALSFGCHSISEPSSFSCRYFPVSFENDIRSSLSQPGGVASSSTTGAADAGGSMASEVVDMMSAELLQINLKIYVLTVLCHSPWNVRYTSLLIYNYMSIYSPRLYILYNCHTLPLL